MSFTIGSATYVSSASQMDEKHFCDKATKLRIKLNAELGQIHKDLHALCTRNFKDDLTKKFVDWVTSFQKAIKTNDLECVMNRYIEEIHQLLKDPIRGYLDENALLGSDGLVYSSMCYGMWRGTVSKAYIDRSPFDPENPSPFTVRKYEPAKVILNWLKRYQLVPVCIETQKRYEQLQKENRIPNVIPESVSIHITQDGNSNEMISSYLEIRKKEKEEDTAIKIEIKVAVKKVIGPIREAAEKLNHDIHQDHQQNMGDLENLRNEFRAQQQGAQNEIKKLSQGISQLHKELDDLKKHQSDVNSSIKAVSAQDTHINQLIVNIEKSIEEKRKKKKKLKKIVKIAAVVGVCFFATWAFGALIGEAPFGAALLPTNGGAKIGLAAFF